MSKPVIRYENGNLVAYSGTADGDLLTWDAGLAEWKAQAAAIVSVDHELFVDKAGNDTTGDGSLSAPFLTIGAALTAANALTGYVRINVAPGSYTGSLTITRSNLIIAGASTTAEERATQIIGSVTVNVTTGGAIFGNNIELSGLYINASGATAPLYVTGNQGFSVTAIGCYITTTTAATPAIRHDNTGASGGYVTRLTLRDCVVTKATAQSTDIIALDQGELRIDTVQVYGPASSATAGAGIALANAAVLVADRLLLDHYAPGAGIVVSGPLAATTTRLTLSNSSVATRYSAGTTAPAISFGNCVAFIWQNIFTVSNSGTKTITGTGLLAATNCYYGELTNGPSATGAIYGSLDTATVTFLPLTETHGNMVLPAVATATRPLKVDANKQVISGLIDLSSPNDVTGTVPAGSQAPQTMAGDVTGTTAASVVAKIQGQPVSSTAPGAAGDVLTWDGAKWLAAAAPAGGSGGGGVIYYFNELTSETGTGLPAGTKGLLRTSQGAASSIGPVSIPVAPTFTKIGGFVTASGDPNLTTVLPPGLWDFNFWLDTTAALNEAYFRVTLYVYNGTTNPESGTAIASSTNVYFYDQGPDAQYTASVIVPSGVTMTAIDRLYVLVEVSGSVSGKTVTFAFGDSTPTHVHSTVPSVTGSGFVKVLNDVIVATGQTVDLASSSDVGTSILGETNGGTGTGTYTKGDILYADATNSLDKLPLGSNGQILTVNTTTGLPEWKTPTFGSGSVTSVSSFDALMTVTNGTTTPVLKINTGTTGSTVAIGNDTRFNPAPSVAGSVPYDTGAAYTALAPVASNLIGWTSTPTALSAITLGTGLALTGTTLDVTGAPPTGAAGGILSGNYPSPSGLVGNASGSIIPLAPFGANTFVSFVVNSSSSSSFAPFLQLFAAQNTGTGTGGSIRLIGGAAGSGTGGAARLVGGASTSGQGGDAFLLGGQSSGSAFGGVAWVNGGDSTSGTGGSVSIRGGSGSVANGTVNVGDANTASVRLGAASRDVTTVGRDVGSPATLTPAAGTSITVTSPVLRLTGTFGSVVMSATPQIVTSGITTGTRLTIINDGSANTDILTFTDANQPGFSASGIQLGGVPTRALAQYQSIDFVFDGTYWIERAVGGAGSVQSVNGVNSLITVTNPTSTPVVGINGLTGTNPGTTGGIPWFSSQIAMSSSALLDANKLMIGGGTGTAPSTLASGGTSGQPLLSGGASAPAFGALDLSVAGNTAASALLVSRGGTGATSVTTNGVVYGSSGTAYTSTTAGTSGQILRAGVTGIPGFGSIDLSSSAAVGVSILGRANGGTAVDNTAIAQNAVFAGPASGGAGNATFRALVSDDIPSLAASKITGIPYDIAGSVAGTPSASSTIFYFKAVRGCTIATTGNEAGAGTPPTSSSTTFEIYKGASLVGTFAIDTSGAATFSISSAISLAAGDVLTVKTQSSINAIADVYFTFFAVVS